jgi:hypothetical protein
MNVRSIAFAAIALVAASTAFAEAAPKPAVAEPRPVAAAREQTLLEGVAVGMREILRTVAPEISLPKIEIKLPKLQTSAL